MVQITLHGRKRMKERLDISYKKDAQVLFRKALNKGKSPNDYEVEFKKYLLKKISDNYTKKIKVYNKTIFIYSGKSKKLITTYPVPEKYIHLVIKNIKYYNKEYMVITDEELKIKVINKCNKLIDYIIINNSVNLDYDYAFDKNNEICKEILKSANELYKRLNGSNIIKNEVSLSKENYIEEITKYKNDFEFICKLNERKEIRDNDKKGNINNTLLELYSILSVLKDNEYFLMKGSEKEKYEI